MNDMERPKPPISGIVYGETIYWGTVLGSIIAIIGSTIAFIYIGNNVMDPGIVFTGIWEGKNSADIWNAGFGSLPEGHWYLANIAKGDGLTMFGLALGVFAVIPGMFASAFLLLKNKQNLYGILALIGGIITLCSFLGLITVPS